MLQTLFPDMAMAVIDQSTPYEESEFSPLDQENHFVVASDEKSKWMQQESDDSPCFVPPEVVDYQMSIGIRDKQVEKRLIGLAGYLGSPDVRSLQFQPPGVLPLGRATHFVLRRTRRRFRGRIAIRLVGYKAKLDLEGRIRVGGAGNVVCSYDLKLSPTPTSCTGVRLDYGKRSTLRIGLKLDSAIEHAHDSGGPPYAQLELPNFLAAFHPAQMPLPQDTLYARRLVRTVLRPGSEHIIAPCTVSPGGVVNEVVRDENGRYLIDFGADRPVLELPAHAQLHPYVQPGVEFAPGASVANLLPRLDYSTWSHVVRAAGDEQAAQFILQQCVLACDYMHPNNFWLLRDVRLVPSHLLEAKQIFEHFALNPEDNCFSPCVVYDAPGLLQFSDGPIDVDMMSLPERWESRFQN